MDNWSYPVTSDEDASFYKENGYLVIPDALSPAEISELRSDSVAICKREWGDVGNLPDYDGTETDEEILRQVLCIHMIHKISPIMHRYLSQRTMVDALTKIIGPNVKCMQSMLFIKAAGKPGQAWHQDEIYIPTRDRSLTGGWMALDDATIENGCLRVVSGFHDRGLYRAWEPLSEKEMEGMEFVPTSTKPGDVILFDSYTPHSSEPNLTDQTRRIYFATYNRLSEGDQLEQYYADKRKGYPPDIEREPDKEYVYRV